MQPLRPSLVAKPLPIKGKLRLWDVLTMLRFAIRGQRGDTSEVRFAVHVRNDNRRRTPPLVRLKAVCGPGDQGEPVLTVMMPDED